jgi:hypothetical protein
MMASIHDLPTENIKKNDTLTAGSVKDIPTVLDELGTHELQMKRTMEVAVNSAKSNYKFKSRINGLLVLIGSILIANPIVFFWLENTGMVSPNISNQAGIPNLNYLLGGMGIVALVSTFFNNPQAKMTIALADLVQFHLICNMYTLEFHGIVGRLKEKVQNTLEGRQGGCDENDIRNAKNEVYDLTLRAMQLVDTYIEKDARSNIKTSTRVSTK